MANLLYLQKSCKDWKLACKSALAAVSRSLLSKGTQLETSLLSVKMIFLISLLLSTGIMVCYRSSMNSFLAVVRPAANIRDMADVLRYSRGLTFWSPIYFESIFTESGPGSAERELYRRFKSDPSANITDYGVGIGNVVRDNYVLIGEEALVRSNALYGCEVSRVPHEIHSGVTVSFFFAKGSPYLPLFNREILRMKNQVRG